MNKIIIQIDSVLIGKDNQPIKPMATFIRGLAGGVIFMTRQPESKRAELYQWLIKYLGKKFEGVPLYMPSDNDDRREAAIVVDWLNDIKKSRASIIAAIDGRAEMLDMWSAAGITCLECHHAGK